jgi:hypothetical protein
MAIKRSSSELESEPDDFIDDSGEKKSPTKAKSTPRKGIPT